MENNKTCGGSCQSSACSCPEKNSLGIAITFDDGKTYDCRLLARFDINQQDYVVLEHPKTKQQLLYRYTDLENQVTLDVIVGREFDIVAKTYQAIME